MLPKFQPVRGVKETPTQDQFESLQRSVEKVLSEVSNREQNDSRLLENVALTNGVTNYISHLLSRQLRGWYVVDNDTNAVVWRSASADSNFLPLSCSANCTVNLLVF